MPCVHPLQGFKTGRKTENGKDEYLVVKGSTPILPLWPYVKRDPSLGDCPKSVIIGGQPCLKDPIPIPCGKCVGCRLDRAKEWKLRCVLESQEHNFNYFLTITYDDVHVPMVNGKFVLRASDLTKFLKRLRKAFGSFRYFACGEYGEKGGRPHFHLIIFSDQELPLVRTAQNKYKSDVIEKTWPFGLHELSFADPGLMAYVSGYVQKKQTNDLVKTYLVRPFLRMSRMPALGSGYMSKVDLALTKRVYAPCGNGSTGNVQKVPRAFLRRIEKVDPVGYQTIKDFNKNMGVHFSKLEPYIYACGDPDMVQMLKDDGLTAVIKDKRHASL